MKKKLNLKPLGMIISIIKYLCAIFLIIIIAVLALQRFSNNEKTIGGFRVFNVATGSMIPKYQVGDVLIVKEQDPNTLKVGDDITYLGEHGSFAGRVVTHQIIEIEESIGGRVFHTKGIANPAEDPTITGDQIYGKVIYKCVLISLLTKLMNNMTAFYVVFFIPFAVLFFLQLKSGRDENEELEEEDEEDEEDEDDEDDEEDDDDDEDDEDEEE